MDKKKKNLLIGGLLAVVLLLAVGYAAFATTLTINGTSSIDSRWDVHIKDNGVNPDPDHTVAATSVTAQKDSQLTGSFSCNLTTPGISTIDYIIEVENSGTFGAKLASVTLTGETYYIGASLSKSSLKQGDVIAGNGGSDTITVTVSYKDVDIVPTLAADKTVAITVTLNFIQDDGSAVATTNGGGNEQNSGGSGLVIDQTFTPDYYEYHVGDVYEGNTYDVTAWTTNPSSLERNYYLGHDVNEQGKVTANYVCFIIDNTQYCLSDISSNDSTNQNIINSLQTAGKLACSGPPYMKQCSGSDLWIQVQQSSVSVGASGYTNCNSSYGMDSTSSCVVQS